MSGARFIFRSFFVAVALFIAFPLLAKQETVVGARYQGKDGTYILGQPIASTQFASLYVAVSESTGEKKVLRFIKSDPNRPHLMTNSEYGSNLFLSGQRATQTPWVHIAHIEEVSKLKLLGPDSKPTAEPALTAVVMEYLPADTIEKYRDLYEIDDVRISRPELEARIHRSYLLALGLIHAVSEMSDQDLTHNDIHPRNVGLRVNDKTDLVTEAKLDRGEVQPVLIDFDGGVKTGSQSNISTPRFYAPERGSLRESTAVSDLYSVGSTLRYLIFDHAQVFPFESAEAQNRKWAEHEKRIDGLLAKLQARNLNPQSRIEFEFLKQFIEASSEFDPAKRIELLNKMSKGIFSINPDSYKVKYLAKTDWTAGSCDASVQAVGRAYAHPSF